MINIIQAHTIRRPPKKSGLNLSGVPYNSQLNRPTEIISTSYFTSDAPSVPSVPSLDPIPDHTLPNDNSVYNPTPPSDISVYNPTTSQNYYNFKTQLSHHDNEPPLNPLDDFPPNPSDDFFPNPSDDFSPNPPLFPTSSSNSSNTNPSGGWFSFGVPNTAYTSHGKCHDNLQSIVTYVHDICSKCSWPHAGEASPTWGSHPWWYHATIATFNVESHWCRSFCSLCVECGSHMSKWFFLVVYTLLIYIFRVPEERWTFWQTTTQSVLLTDSPLPQPQAKILRLLVALQYLFLLPRGRLSRTHRKTLTIWL